MECFQIGGNNFEGAVDFMTLPENVKEIVIYGNQFIGSAFTGSSRQFVAFISRVVDAAELHIF